LKGTRLHLKREFPAAPIVGVGAVVVDGDRVLLVRRGQEPLKGEWSLPGGVLELGETLEQGVCREVLEETGLHVKVVSIVEVLDRIVTQPDALESSAESNESRIRFHYVLIDYLCRVASGSLNASSDADDARWVLREELGVFKVSPVTIAVIEKALGIEEQGR
jgi:8-oxo-dGTP diphosphatase